MERSGIFAYMPICRAGLQPALQCKNSAALHFCTPEIFFKKLYECSFMLFPESKSKAISGLLKIYHFLTY